MVPVEEYVHYQARGYLGVRGLVPMAEVEATTAHAMGILRGTVPVPGIETPPAGTPVDDLVKRYTRIHMLHRVDAVSERCLLQPRVLDVLEALIGPDVVSLQTMLFYNPPGLGGQGWHQDSYYITTYPDTLIGAWIALDRADPETGCLWVVPGSHHQPIHPDRDRGSLIHAEGALDGLTTVENVSHMDDAVNTLSRVVAQYPDPIPVAVEPGDVVFFNGHLLHRSFPNRAQERWRRAFVSHYCNARSWVPWDHGLPFEGDCANAQHILARGATHLPFAKPRFGTPCAALEERPKAADMAPALMMATEKGMEKVSAWDPGDRWGKGETER